VGLGGFDRSLSVTVTISSINPPLRSIIDDRISTIFSPQIIIRLTREGKPTTNKPIALMVRNLLPPSECIECKESALYLCLECLYDLNVWGTLCERHLKQHEHQDNYDPVQLVNSPRLGMCGYDGPAEAPY
jgi:hypothetical protein